MPNPPLNMLAGESFVADCPDHGKPRRAGRAGEIEPSCFRCDDCSIVDTMLDPRDIRLEWNETWSVTSDGLLMVTVWEEMPEDD
jgi:hypothetical protein